MANNVFATDPVDQLIQTGTAPAATDPRSSIEGIAVKTRVPANFLMAFAERTQASNDDERLRQAAQIADKVAPRIAAGEKIEDIVRSLNPGNRKGADDFIERAYQIADELYPSQPKAAPEEDGMKLTDPLKQIAGSAVTSIGQAISGGVRGLEGEGNDNATDWQKGNRETAIAAGEALTAWGEGMKEGVSDAAKKAMADSSPDGSVFNPSTWSFGKKPSLTGYSMLAADVLGSFLPVVVTAIATKSPTASAAAGGAIGGGNAAETAREVILTASKTVGPDGRSLLEANSAFYRDLISQGKSPEEALATTLDAGERMAFMLTAPVSAFGGAATEKILAGGVQAVASKGPLARIVGTAGLSGLEEGAQEATETLATRYGIKSGSGMNVDMTQGTFGDFILGAIGGAGPGAVGGALNREDQPEAQPAPEQAPPMDVPPGMVPPAPEAVQPTPVAPPAPKRPMRDAAKLAPAPTFSKDGMGGTVTVKAGDLEPFTGKIVSDNGVMVTVRDDSGEEMQVAHSQIESGEASIDVASPSDVPPVSEKELVPTEPIKTAQDAAEQAAKIETYANENGWTPDLTKMHDDMASAAKDLEKDQEEPTLSEKALAKITPRPGEKVEPLTPAEAMRRLKLIEDQVKAQGWNKRLTKKHAEMTAIIEAAKSPFDAPADALKEMGYYDGPWNEAAAPTPSEVPSMDGTEEAPSASVSTSSEAEGVQPIEASAEAPAEPSTDPASGSTPDAGALNVVEQTSPQVDIAGAPAPQPEPKAKKPTARELVKGLRDAANAREDAYDAVEAGTMDPEQLKTVIANVATAKTALSDAIGPEKADEQFAKIDSELEKKRPKPEPKAEADTSKAVEKIDKAEPPREPVAPMRAPDERIQPDMLGGRDQTETEMARKERRRIQWGKYVAIAEARSPWQGDLERATVKITKHEITLTGPDGSRTTATDGMSRADIVSWSRRAMQVIGGFEQEGAAKAADTSADGVAPSAKEVAVAAKEADRNPTEAQKEAGNYKMGHIAWNGLDITIETAKGAYRRGKDSDGEEWSVKLPAHYGYIKRTEGADGDHVDVYMGPNPESDSILIVDQIDLKTRKFDEHKVMLGFNAVADAKAAYEAGFSDGKGGLRRGGTMSLNVDQFKAWLKHADMTKRANEITHRDLNNWVAQDQGSESDKAKDVDASPASGTGLRVFINKVGKDGLTDAERAAGQKPLSDPEPPARPKMGDPGYTLADAEADLAAVRAEYDAQGMIKNARTGDQMRKLQDLVKQMKDEVAAKGKETTTPDDPATKPLSVLSQAEQDRAALLRARIAERLKTQMNSGIDPELIRDAVELVGIYIKAGIRKFRAMVDQIGSDMGLTAKEAEPWVRAAYNQARDDMELADEDVSDMDDAKAVLAEVKNIRAEASKKPAPNAISKGDETPAEPANVPESGPSVPSEMGEDGERQSGEGGNVGTGQPDGNRGQGDVAAAEPAALPGDDGGRGAGRTRARRGGEPAGDGEGSGSQRVEPERREGGSLPRLDDARSPAPKGRANYRITDPEKLIGGTPKRRFAKNRAAIEAYQKILDEKREPTPEELDALASFIGWGSFGQDLFQGTWQRPIYKDGWKEENDWLRAHLGETEWKAAQNSIINAHYTDPPTVQAMWRMVERLGFKGGRVLEPSMGIGNFFGMMPAQIAANSQLTGIELDPLTGGMAKLLYPQANVQIMGYEKSQTPDGYYDVVIGNWPFANFSPADRRYSKLAPSLHDYFFLKAMDQVRPGGLVIGITSAFTMDKQSVAIRQELAKKAELVDSFRLPSGSFEQYAGTSVVTDIMILQKRETPLLDVSETGWIKTQEVDTPAGTPVRVNQIYATYPQNVLGTINFGSGSTYGRPSMIVNRPADLMERLENLHTRLPEGRYQATRRGKEARFIANNTSDPQRSIIEKDGALYQVQGERLVRFEDIVSYKTSNAKVTAQREAEIRGLIDLRKKMGAVLDADRDGAEDAEAKRKALKTAYDAFVKANGKIVDSVGLSYLKKAMDPGAAMVSALENRDGTKAAIMERSTVRAERSLANPNIRDAFVLARNESTVLDLARVAELAKKTTDEVTADLLAGKAIYRTPGGGFEASDTYLAGNVRQKLKDALRAQEQGEDMAGSIEALKGVVPADVPYFNIEAKLGAMWIPAEIYQDYLSTKFGLSDGQSDKVGVRYSAGAWHVEFPKGLRYRADIAALTGGDMDPKQFVSFALNNQSISIRRKDSEGREYKDDEASKKANELASKLREDFSTWVWADPERRMNLEASYNDAMNAVATPSYDGSFLNFTGMALERGDQPFNLRSHQANAIWRGVLNGRGIYAHEVGTGKTITMAGIAVESRRYGLAKKPLLIAHNANSKAVANEMQEIYPGGKFLYVDNMTPDEIDATLHRIKTDDWDAIIIPHSLIDRMALKESTLMAMAASEIAAYEHEAMEAAQQENAHVTLEMMDDEEAMKKVRSPTAKQLVKARNQIIEKIKKQALRSSKEGAVTFEDLGIDQILVDEAHEFKKPPIATRMTVKGLNKSVSSRSLQLKFLTDYVKGINGGKGVHVFTGTPITNTLAEIYHQMRYTMDDVMKQSDVYEWDGFFNTFAASIPDIELTASGDYESVERLSAFVNVAELRRMAGQFMDIVFADDMPEFTPRATSTGKNLKNGTLTEAERRELTEGMVKGQPIGRPYKKVIHDIAEMEPVQRRILDEVVSHARKFRTATGKTKMEIMRRGGPDAPIVFNNVPTRAGLDVRLHDPSAPDYASSKANRAARNVAQIYKAHPKSTQVIFMDEGYSDEATRTKKDKDGKITKTKVTKFNLASDIVRKLVEAGIPREEIAVVDGGVTKEKRAEIATKMNELKIRVVIGQTRTLGVGVNMQKYLRAMHHLDAPWMPGDLEQRNGRGQRQGNLWNTVLEYRYLTEGLDGRRWQVLTIKDTFIKAFLKARNDLRVIEGDATDDATSMDAESLSQTLSEAAGDPRIFQAKKLEKDIVRLKGRERLHTEGIADAKHSIKRIEGEAIPRSEKEAARFKEAAAEFDAARADGFVAKIGKETFDDRAKAQEAWDSQIAAEQGQADYSWKDTKVSVYGVPVQIQRSYSGANYRLGGKGVREYETMGKPTIASAEAGLRALARQAEYYDERIADDKRTVERLKTVIAQPFQQAEALAKKVEQLDTLRADMAANPIAPPSWLRQATPIDSVIYVDGKPKTVTGHRWTAENWFVSTTEGDVAYTDATDEAGLPIYDARTFQAPKIEEGSKLKTGEERESRFIGPAPVVASARTGDVIKGPTLPDRQRNALAWFRQNLIGKTVTNEETGMVVGFNGAGARKSVNRAGDDALAMIPVLPEIIAGSRYLGVDGDTKGRDEVKSFHRFAASVDLDGVTRDVIVIARELPDGTFQYRLARDNSVGARFLRNPSGVVEPNATSPSALDGDTDTINIDIAEPDFNEDAPDQILDEAVASVMRQHGLDSKVSVRLVAKLIGRTGKDIAGRYRDGEIALNPSSGDVLGTLRHEIVHAIRPAFTLREWRRLANAVTQFPEIVERVRRAYADTSPMVQEEEMVAEFYREWASGQLDLSSPERAAARTMLGRIAKFIAALVDAFRDRGLNKAVEVLERVASGEIGARLPERGRDERGRFISEESRFINSMPAVPFAKNEAEVEERERGYIGNLLTNAMNGKAGVNLLALVPGRALFAELGKKLPGAASYLRFKEQMDTLRQEWHSKTDTVAQAWRKILSKDGKANVAMMDLMHDATIAGVDPSAPFKPRADEMMKRARAEVNRHGPSAAEWALSMIQNEEKKREAHARLEPRFKELPEAFQAMFSKVRDTYGELGTAIEDAVISNAEKAMKIGIDRAKIQHQEDLDQIRDDGLQGDERREALNVADAKLEAAKKRAGWNKSARLAALRAKFESNRLDGPYFPLARFGQFFMTVRDEEGKVVSFSRFETENAQKKAAAQAKADKLGEVTIGVLSDAGAMRDQVDPNFVADIEEILGEAATDPAVMDMVWQRWLETLPDTSVRRSRLHRKGTPGYDTDAFRAFARQMFHGSHQLARMTYALDMQKALEDARRQAGETTDPNRAGLVVTEMERRHEFTMNPTGSAWAQRATSAAFVYYLAVTPAAALVNVTQTTMVGIPILSAGFPKSSIGEAAVAVGKAGRDFIAGKGGLEGSPNLTADEKAALAEAYERGTIDKSQSHDLAGISESGVEYSDIRQKWMGRISYLFHHAERFNREVTFLAAYRMARAHGFEGESAIAKAADLTWKSHFDYQNTSRPRLMQNDAAKVLLTFRNYSINLIWRLFRDVHQSLKGASEQDRREARRQLVGITMQMLLHAGIKGVWGYGLLTMLLGMFFDDGKDDVEEILQSALVDTFGPNFAGMLLNGVPGHVMGVDMTNRIGMADLWFRSSDRNLEGDDVYNYWLQQMVGPVPGIFENSFRGVQKIGDGDVWRGLETLAPKVMRDAMQSYRFYSEGATTASGIPILDEVPGPDILKKALGFTPARLAERYEANTRMKNKEDRIEIARSDLIGDAARELKEGGLTDRTKARIAEFNANNRDYPIDGASIRKSLKGSARATFQAKDGVRLNTRLDRRIRMEAAQEVYN